MPWCNLTPDCTKGLTSGISEPIKGLCLPFLLSGGDV